jgi:hypothetical protein
MGLGISGAGGGIFGKIHYGAIHYGAIHYGEGKLASESEAIRRYER